MPIAAFSSRWMGTDFFVAEVFNNLCCRRNAGLLPGSSKAIRYRNICGCSTSSASPSPAFPARGGMSGCGPFPNGGFTPPQSLRVVVTGMEQVNPAALETWKREVGTRIRWFNAYGPTETTCTSTIYEAGSSEWEGEQYVPIGKPVANTQVYVLDRRRKPVPVGVPGELYIGGVGVARGYLNSPELTAERFLPDPFSADPAGPHVPHRRSGISASRRQSGFPRTLGSAGENPWISRGARRDRSRLDQASRRSANARWWCRRSDERLIAYVSPPTMQCPRNRPTAPASFGASRRSHDSGGICRSSEHAAHFGRKNRSPIAVPRSIRMLAADREFKQPVTPTEKLLSELWQQALGIPVADATANFFELGGDSLKAAQLIVLIQRAHGNGASVLHLAASAHHRAYGCDSRQRRVRDRRRSIRDGTPLCRCNHKGHLTPFFCISPTLQGPFCYRHLSKHLGTDQPFFVVRVLPKEAERVPTVEELAERAVQSIRATSRRVPTFWAVIVSVEPSPSKRRASSSPGAKKFG